MFVLILFIGVFCVVVIYKFFILLYIFDDIIDDVINCDCVLVFDFVGLLVIRLLYLMM